MSKNNGLISVAQATIHTDDEVELRLNYSLCSVADQEGKARYSLRVDKYHPGGELIESKESLPFTYSLREAAVLVEAFAAGTVMPCALQEMVTEWKDDIIVAC